MAQETYRVFVAWDEIERRFFVENSDIPGLWLTNPTFEGLLDAIRDVAAELIEANCKTAQEPRIRIFREELEPLRLTA